MDAEKPEPGARERRKTRTHLRYELRQLLSLAEKLHESIEYNKRRILLMFFALLMLAAFGMTGLMYYIDVYKSIKTGYFIVFMIYGTLALCPFLMLVLRILQSTRRDLRAFHNLVDMLREVEIAAMEKGNMSTLERAEFSIRLARLDIGKGNEERDYDIRQRVGQAKPRINF